MVLGVVAGVGVGLVAPAISAYHLDLSGDDDRSRAIGLREAAIALGDVVGPLALVLTASFVTSSQVFSLAGAVALGAAAAAVLLR